MNHLNKKILLFLVLMVMPYLKGFDFPITDKTNVAIFYGDITRSNVEAIVNAANEQLLGGGGVCGAIFAAADRAQLQVECDKYPICPGTNTVRCPTGQARITSSCALAKRGIQYIIHTVGPDCRKIFDKQEQDELLTKTYESALALADQHGITSIAFPFISSSIYAFPKERAARIALETINKYILEHKNMTCLKQVNIVLFIKDDYNLFIKKSFVLKN